MKKFEKALFIWTMVNTMVMAIMPVVGMILVNSIVPIEGIICFTIVVTFSTIIGAIAIGNIDRLKKELIDLIEA